MNKKIIFFICLISSVCLQDLFIKDIVVSGNKSMSDERIFANAGLFPKETYIDINQNNKYDIEDDFRDYNSNGYFDRRGSYIKTGEEFKDAINNLWNLQIFSDVKIFILDQDKDNIDIEISVEETLLIGEILFFGNKKIKDKKIMNDIITLKSSDRLVMNEVYSAIEKIKNEYIDKDFHDIKVTYELTDSEELSEKNITFYISEGKKMKINNIELIGNDSYSKKEIIKNAFVNLKEKKWGFFKNKFNGKADLKDEITNLYNFYNNEGYRDFRVISENIVLDKSGVNIIIKMDEGEKNYYNDFIFSGNIMFSNEDLMDALHIKKGDQFNKQMFDLSVFNLNSKYYDEGYYFLNNEYKIKPLKNNLINVYFDIKENNQTKIRKILISGNSKTNDNVIRRELQIYPGDIFSMKKLRQSYGEVLRLNFFSLVDPQINIVNNSSDKVDVNFNVIEKETGRANFSMGYNEEYGLTGGGGFEFSNFRGRGQLLSIDYSRGIQQQGNYNQSFSSSSNNNDYESFSFSFREPSLNNTPNSLGVSFSHTERGRKDNTYLKYDITSNRVSLSLGHRFNLSNYLLRGGWTLSYREIKYFGTEELLLEDFSENIITSNGDENYASRVGVSLTQRFSRDTRDYPDFPTKGTNISWTTTFAGHALGGNENYHRNIFDFNWYTSMTDLPSFVLYQDFVFGVTEEMGENEYLPYNAKFRMGGDGIPNGEMLRGYNNNSIYGYESAGGKIMFKYSSELRYLMSRSPVSYFFIFAEAGNVWPDFDDFDLFNLKRSLGIGFRIYMPMLGILGYDYGYGFDSINEFTNEPVGWQGHIIFGMPIN